MIKGRHIFDVIILEVHACPSVIIVVGDLLDLLYLFIIGTWD